MPCRRVTHLNHISEETMAKMTNRTATTVTATGTTTLLTYAPLSEMYDRHVVNVHPFSIICCLSLISHQEYRYSGRQ